MYVNGVMSGMSSYAKKNTHDHFPLGADTLFIGSDLCDIDFYQIRIYDKPLTSANVV
jgi:hypothetical protein